jgi:tRNA (adenine22-N1)-methyltransferase
VQRGVADRALAMDVRKGPLSMAQANIRDAGLGERISVRLSDGLKELKAGEADGLVIAGMGGKLMISILDERDVVALGIKMAVLQPQSDIDEFRRYLRSKGYTILDERVVLDEGKYYFPILVEFKRGAEVQEGLSPQETELSRLLSEHKPDDGVSDESSLNNDDILRISDRYGVYNILRKDPLLKKYLLHGKEVAQSIITTLDEETHSDRYGQLLQELKDIEIILSLYD